MFSRLYSAQTSGLEGQIITIELDTTKSMHNAFSVVGLPDKAVEESRDRVSSAIKNSGYKNPKSEQLKIIASLSPADIKKEGSNFDLAIAVGYLLSREEIEFDPEKKIFLGELALNGELRSVRGTLLLTQKAKEKGFKEIILPKQNAREAALVDGIKIYGAETLDEVLKHLDEGSHESFKIKEQEQTVVDVAKNDFTANFSDIAGQETAKRGLEIAAAGGHNIAMYGPPGTGKTMLAKAFTGILPGLSREDSLEVTGIHSASGVLDQTIISHPPFRSPHNTASYVSIIGGGANPKPGEVTLAHKGVLFMDEFPEFDRRVLESLRQPLEDRKVQITRAKGTATFPTSFILVAAMNPPDDKATASDIVRFERKISGPIMDRIDMWVNVDHIEYEELDNKERKGESSEVIRERILTARETQNKRLGNKLNCEMGVREISEHIDLEDSIKKTLNDTARTLNLSPRSYHRVIKLSRTIADLEGSENVDLSHVLEALQYRPKEF